MHTLDRRALLAGTAATLAPAILTTKPARPTSPSASPAATRDIRELAEKIIADAGIPGCVLLTQTAGNEPHIVTIGHADMERTTPVSADMHVRIGSITKPFTATIVLQLIDEGALALTDTLADRLPIAAKLPHAAEITIEHLLTMTSGLAEYLNHPESFRHEALNTTPKVPIEHVISWAGDQEPQFTPGGGARYCNTNYRLLTAIVQHVTGKGFPDLVNERIVKPLGLTHTFVQREATLPHPAPQSYSYFRSMLARMAAAGQPLDLTGMPRDFATPDVNDPPMNVSRLEQDASAGDGNIVSTIREMNTFMRAIVDGTLVSPELSRRQLDTRHTFPPLKYGMGILRILDTVGHGGNIQGFSSWACVDPANGTSYALWTNADPTKVDLPPNLQLLGILTGRPMPDFSSTPQIAPSAFRRAHHMQSINTSFIDVSDR